MLHHIFILLLGSILMSVGIFIRDKIQGRDEKKTTVIFIILANLAWIVSYLWTLRD